MSFVMNVEFTGEEVPSPTLIERGTVVSLGESGQEWLAIGESETHLHLVQIGGSGIYCGVYKVGSNLSAVKVVDSSSVLSTNA